MLPSPAARGAGGEGQKKGRGAYRPRPRPFVSVPGGIGTQGKPVIALAYRIAVSSPAILAFRNVLTKREGDLIGLWIFNRLQTN